MNLSDQFAAWKNFLPVQYFSYWLFTAKFDNFSNQTVRGVVEATFRRTIGAAGIAMVAKKYIQNIRSILQFLMFKKMNFFYVFILVLKSAHLAKRTAAATRERERESENKETCQQWSII